MFVSSRLLVAYVVSVSERLTVGWALVCQSQSLSLLCSSSLPPLFLLSLSSLPPLAPLSLPQASVSFVCSGRLGCTSVNQREREKTILSEKSDWSSESRWTPESSDIFAEDLNSTKGKPGHWTSSRSDVRKLSLFITNSHFLIGCLSVTRQTLSVTLRWEITHSVLSDWQLWCLPLRGSICSTLHLCFNSR